MPAAPSARTSETPRIVAIVPARAEKDRALAPVSGEPLLWHVVERLKASERIGDIAVATTIHPQDDTIAEFAAMHGIKVVRGPEDNVLARFARTAEALDADIIVHVPCRARLAAAGLADHLVTALIAQGGDYIRPEDDAGGIEVLTRRALDRLMMDAPDDPVAREQVTGYFRAHPDFVAIAHAAPYRPHRIAPVGDGEATLDDLKRLMQHAHRKASRTPSDQGLTLIRCDGGGSFGYGRVKRMIALGQALRAREGIEALYAVHGSADILAPIRRAGFAAHAVCAEGNALAGLIGAHRPDLLVFDCQSLPPADVRDLSRGVALTATIDDLSESRLAADLAYYPPLPQAERLDWHGSDCTVRIGWDWALLGLAQVMAPRRSMSPRPTLLVAMGGSDCAGLTLRMAEALAPLDPVFRARFVIGPGMARREQTARAIVGLGSNFETIEGADGLATEYASADLALAAFGVMAYELAAFGVPALYLSRGETDALSALAFEYAGMGASLGPASRVCDAEIAKAVWALLGDTARRRDMRAAGLATIDGKGAARIAADLGAALAARRTVPAAAAAL